jgi:hypothetical protein
MIDRHYAPLLGRRLLAADPATRDAARRNTKLWSAANADIVKEVCDVILAILGHQR